MEITGSITVVDDETIHIFKNNGRVIIQVPRALMDYTDVVCLNCGLSGIVGPDVCVPIKHVLTQELKQAKEAAFNGRNANTTTN